MRACNYLYAPAGKWKLCSYSALFEREGDRSAYLPSASCNSCLSAYASIFLRKTARAALPYIREVLTLSKQEKQSFTCLKHGSKRLKYLPSANVDSASAAKHRRFSRKTDRVARILKAAP